MQLPLPSILGSVNLVDIASINKFLQDACKTLLGYAQYLQKFGNVKAGLTIYEMKDAVMCTAKTDFNEQGVCIAGKIPVGEEQKLNQGPDARLQSWIRDVFLCEQVRIVTIRRHLQIMSALLTYFCASVTFLSVLVIFCLKRKAKRWRRLKFRCFPQYCSKNRDLSVAGAS